MSKNCNKDKNNPVSKFEQSVTKLSSCLPKYCANYFLFFLLDILFADQYRRTVTSWIQHSQLAHKFRNFFHHLPQIGHNNDNLLHQFLSELLNSHRHLFDGLTGIRLVVDDTTTKHYGQKIEGCGWNTVSCLLYGKTINKRYKTFVCVSELSHWQPVRIVLVLEEDGTWVPLMSTNLDLSVQEIIESYGVRLGIEEVFKDLKDNYGWGKQEVRNLFSSIGVTVMNMLVYNVTELCCWNIPSSEIVDRSARPWDNTDRSPSHRDKRKYMKLQFLQKELKALLQSKQNPKKIFEKLKAFIMLHKKCNNERPKN